MSASEAGLTNGKVHSTVSLEVARAGTPGSFFVLLLMHRCGKMDGLNISRVCRLTVLARLEQEILLEVLCYIYMFMYVYVYVHMYICMCVCVYVCVCVCVCVHIYEVRCLTYCPCAP